jgi:hypothetical protein
VPCGWGERDPAPIDGLRFASIFFDAFLSARIDDTINAEFSLLCASAYYLAGNVGSATVVIRRMDPPELDLAGGLGRLVHAILGNDFRLIDGEHAHAADTAAVLSALGGYMRFDNDMPRSSKPATRREPHPMRTDRRGSCSTAISSLRSVRANCVTRREPCFPPHLTWVPTHGGQRSPSRFPDRALAGTAAHRVSGAATRRLRSCSDADQRR